MTELKGQTLAELDVQPGDVVKLASGGVYTIADNPHKVLKKIQVTVNGRGAWLYDHHEATIVSRAKPTRAQIDEQP